jgi:hypothetical protein
MTDPEHSGVVFAVERTNVFHFAMGLSDTCLFCGRRFPLPAAAIRVLALGEDIGSLGPCCLDGEAREAYAAACRYYETE